MTAVLALIAALAGFLVGLWIMGAAPDLWWAALVVAVLGCWGAAAVLGTKIHDSPGEDEK